MEIEEVKSIMDFVSVSLKKEQEMIDKIAKNVNERFRKICAKYNRNRRLNSRVGDMRFFISFDEPDSSRKIILMSSKGVHYRAYCEKDPKLVQIAIDNMFDLMAIKGVANYFKKIMPLTDDEI